MSDEKVHQIEIVIGDHAMNSSVKVDGRKLFVEKLSVTLDASKLPRVPEVTIVARRFGSFDGGKSTTSKPIVIKGRLALDDDSDDPNEAMADDGSTADTPDD